MLKRTADDTSASVAESSKRAGKRRRIEDVDTTSEIKGIFNQLIMNNVLLYSYEIFNVQQAPSSASSRRLQPLRLRPLAS